MTMASPCPKPDKSTIADQFSALEHTYPLWRIKPRPRGMWSATRILPATPAQAAAGLQCHTLQPDLDALAAFLCEQFRIAQTIR